MKFIMYLVVTVFAITTLSAQSFEGERVNATFGYQMKDINYCSFFRYFIDADTELENGNLKRLQNQYIGLGFFKVEGSNKKSLEIKSILTFKWNKSDVALIGFVEINNEQSSDKLLFKVNPDQISIDTSIEEVLKLSNEAFWQFYNSSNDNNYPEINRLKLEARDSNNTLNLYKLAIVIKNNTEELSKYLRQ